ncbi:uncharacterized protein DUF4280 [Flavobacterium araucananum]|uniref:DUF4280 domain-containing protein n=1 Tax=Flavobacterium araucananum TaxID=946678 RepID=A0A227P3A9_9FLAO|nr:PAAR-like protein [Flavobacterium araucananum]OXG04389.1 hypothetical protein B0A64_15220 [Flavobacterium araucananum]PWK01211.1 uncharacterized protein DUF4280 [Flavobacterium araucananum]
MAKPDITARRKLREEKEDAEDGLKFVIDGAKIRCDLCTIPDGDLKTNYDAPSIQDKRVVTVVERDRTSLIFKGNCKKSFFRSSPCATVMKLGEWKNPGTVYFQDELAVLLRSTIKCEYGGVDIKIWDCGQRNEIINLDTTGLAVPDFTPDFDVKFELDQTENTIVPFGILDFENKEENQFFRFKYTLEKNNIDKLYFEIIAENGEQLYAYTCLKPVIIQNENKEHFFKTEKTSQIPMASAEATIGSPDFEPVDYTTMGSYTISWDGFDNDDIYDSTRFNGKEITARITAIKDNIPKTIAVDFSTKYNEVKWTDVKIDKKTKRIDVTLRVNLTDGGAQGLECNTFKIGEEISSETFTSNELDPFKDIVAKICPWDKIPEDIITPDKPIIKKRTRSFKELEKLAIEGLNYHWGRNRNHNEGKNVKINKVDFEVFINSINTNQNSIGGIKLIYNTNGNWLRSGNPDTIEDPMSAVGNLVSRKAICYNIAYIKNERWDYYEEESEDCDFMFTSAHEIGHTILKAYGGTIHSYGHKGSVNPYTQNKNENAVIFPLNGEIDIMPYYINRLNIDSFNKYIAVEKDVLSFIWLTKIKLK